MRLFNNKIMWAWTKLAKGIFLLLFIATACNDSTDDTTDVLGDWIRKSDFEGVARSGAVTFTIDSRVFVGTGFDGTARLKDLWEYDVTRNTWFKRANFPGVARNSAVAFSANGKGYVGTGYDGTNRLKDFWEYNPTTDQWRQVADFEGSARYGSVAVSINNKGYVGGGYDGNDLKDWWEYVPGEGTIDDSGASLGRWVQKVSIGGYKRTNAFAFVINGKAYVGGGTNNGIYPIDFWMYNPTDDSWTQKKSLDDDIDDDDTYDYALQRTYASTFVINGYGYIVGGTYSTVLGDTWEYNPTEDTWVQKTTFEGTAREAAVGFAVGSTGYLVTGRNSTTRFDDIWALDPTAEEN